MTEEKIAPARYLLETLVKQADEIDNIMVVYSKKDSPEGSASIGTTTHTPVIWTLGALDYARWHMFNVLTMAQMVRASEGDVGAAELEMFKDSGGKPS